VPSSSPRPLPRVTLAALRRAGPTVDVATAAAALGCGKSTLYDAIARGDAPVRVIPVGRRLRVPTAELIGLLEDARPAASRADVA
jgi:excisionase family DNA binding protein